jgi:carbon-monoxide dehydrogenase small subunit
MIISVTVNGQRANFEVAGHESLLWALRERLGLSGAKDVCEQGECGACSVVMDDKLVCSCLVLAADTEGSEITTVEGLGSEDSLHPVQQAFLEHGAAQCGYCTPGLVVAAARLLETRESPTSADLREALSGNLCRCTGYGSVLRALEALFDAREPT